VLCQPAGTPILVQTGRRLGVTLIDLEADILCPIHVSVERVVVFFTHVQATLNTLSLVFPTAYTARLARVALVHFYDLDSLDFRLVFEDVREPVERPAVQFEIAVTPPVLRFTVFIFTDTSEFPDVDSTNVVLDTSF